MKSFRNEGKSLFDLPFSLSQNHLQLVVWLSHTVVGWGEECNSFSDACDSSNDSHRKRKKSWVRLEVPADCCLLDGYKFLSFSFYPLEITINNEVHQPARKWKQQQQHLKRQYSHSKRAACNACHKTRSPLMSLTSSLSPSLSFPVARTDFERFRKWKSYC